MCIFRFVLPFAFDILQIPFSRMLIPIHTQMMMMIEDEIERANARVKGRDEEKKLTRNCLYLVVGFFSRVFVSVCVRVFLLLLLLLG